MSLVRTLLTGKSAHICLCAAVSTPLHTPSSALASPAAGSEEEFSVKGVKVQLQCESAAEMSYVVKASSDTLIVLVETQAVFTTLRIKRCLSDTLIPCFQ